MRLNDGDILHGVVLFESGAPAAKAVVVLSEWPALPGAKSRRTACDAAGRFEFDQLPSGTRFTLRAGGRVAQSTDAASVRKVDSRRQMDSCG